MARKISKSQRTGRGGNVEVKSMAKIVVAEKNEKGHYSFKQKMVPLDQVQDELKAARA